MKRKVLSSVALIVTVLLLLPIITSCSCGTENNPDDLQTDTFLTKSAPSLRWLRINKISSDSVTLKVNTIGENLEFDVRYSDTEITEENFNDATKADSTVDSGEGYAVITVKGITADAENRHYIAVKVTADNISSKVECIKAGGLDIIPIKYGEVNSVYAGQANRDFASKLFDEQTVADPLNGDAFMALSGYSILYNGMNVADTVYNEKSEYYGMVFKPVIDLGCMTYVECIYVYYGKDAYPITVRTSDTAVDYNDPDAWNVTSERLTNNSAMSWNRVDIGKEIQYILLEYKNGEIPTEVLIYGYATGEGDTIVTTETHPLPTMGEMMGMCALVNSGVSELMPAGVIREYHNVGWSYNYTSFPKSCVNFQTPHGLSDNHYSIWAKKGLNVIPCLQWKAGNNDEVAHVYDPTTNELKREVADYYQKLDPDTYIGYASLVFNYAARYGSNSSSALNNIMENSANVSYPIRKAGLNYIGWIELGNEPNGEDSSGYNAYQLAALTSAAYDGHMKTVGSKYFSEDSYAFGGKNADTNIKIAMAGVAGIQNTMIGTMVYWMKSNRSDGSIAMDAFNVHNYFPKTFVMNGENITTGVSPEEFGLADALSKLIDFRDKYYPEKEVWLTEFGWDTAQSYLAPTAAHAYGEYTSRQVQAMWLVRAYLILSSVGIDKATMYMCRDEGYETTNSGKYGTCGLIDIEGKKKDSFYYVYTLKNTLGKYTFVREIDSQNPDVWIYEYADNEGHKAYALWCPTSDGTKVDGFSLRINGESATLVENVNGETCGVKTKLSIKDNTVTVNVSENPIYILAE